MVIIGTGGLAKDIVGSLARDTRHKEYFFYNDRKDCIDNLFVNRYKIIHTLEELEIHFKTKGNQFVSALANPMQRFRMNTKLQKIGGVLTTLMALKEDVSEFNIIEKGTIIQPNVVISSDVKIGEGTFINSGNIIGHDCKIGKYVSFGPGCRILGNVEIGDFSYIGTNVVIYPHVKIGKKVRISIGKIIDKDIPDNTKF